jgi:hypothetical protein
MLDCRHARTECCHDSWFTVTVSSHDTLGSFGFLDNCAQFLVTELLMNRVIHFADHSA